MYNDSDMNFSLSKINDIVKLDYKIKRNKIKHKHNAELQRTDPGTKVMDEFSTKGRIYPPNA